MSSIVRTIVTDTSSKATGTGAWGLWIVTSTSCTRPKPRTTSATREASVSMRLTGSPSMTPTTAAATDA